MLKEHLVDLDMDMDQIRYDMGKTGGQLKKEKEEYKGTFSYWKVEMTCL
ncbi:MAG: hypothetical protein HUJ72_10260 [Blautia sp.]|nr:hypothetical protein [Blautia sp.]